MKKRKVIAAGILMCGLFLSGCSGQDAAQFFNGAEEVSVDNDTKNQQSVDNQNGGNAENKLEDSGANVNDENSNNKTGSSTEYPNGNSAGTSENSNEKTAQSERDERKETYTGATISLVMVGDMLLHTPVEESALQEDGKYNFDAIFANTRSQIQVADIALVNQEVIIGGEELGISGYPCFNAPYEAGDALVNAGFDVICHATNHALDQGKKGVKNCLNFWKNSYPETTVLGINQSQEAQDSIYIYEQDGIQIAILNYTYGTNGIEIPSDMPYAVNLLNEEKVTADIKKAEELADFTVVCPHWGTEYELGISAEQEKWTKLFMENGVDLVLGTHPHVIEPIELLVDEETGNEMLVYYSLGNFVNWTASSGEGIANRMVGGMAEVTIGQETNGEGFILDYGVTAVVCHLEEGTNGVTTYPLSKYSEELAEKNKIIAQDSNFSKEYCTTLCNTVWGDLWK